MDGKKKKNFTPNYKPKKKDREESNEELDLEQDFPTIDGITEFPNDGREEKTKKKKSGGFQSMGLNLNILRGVVNKGYKVPTPIQRKVVPVIMQGGDVVAMARTGSGKTAAFLIPMLQKLKTHSAKVGARALILSPTRELALQTMKFCADIGKYTDLRACVIVGGDSMESQFLDLSRNPDIIIATPGRLLHHLVEIEMTLNLIEYLVFDEADRLFETKGFKEQLDEIVAKIGKDRQTVLMSATMPKAVVEFASIGLRDPSLIRLDTESKLSENLKLEYFICRQEEKIGALKYLLSNHIKTDELTIIFFATRHHVEFFHEILNQASIRNTVIYGSMDHSARNINLAKFRNGSINVLLVTDVAARGIDIPLLDNVINYDFPGKPKLFVHRAGRVARAGRSGVAYSLVSNEELAHLIDLHLFLGKPMKETGDGDTYGRFPQPLLDFHCESTRNIIQSSPDLVQLQRVVNNAYKMYYKTRPIASSESVKRAKEMSVSHIHPIFEEFLSTSEIEQTKFVESLKKFRPSQTILELKAKNSKNHSTINSSAQNSSSKSAADAVEVMKVKRYIHGGIIAKKYEVNDENDDDDDQRGDDVNVEDGGDNDMNEVKQEILNKRRKKRKRKTSIDPNFEKLIADDDDYQDDNMGVGMKKQKSFKDEEFFMSHVKENSHDDQGYSLNEFGNFQKSVRDVILDMVPDEKDAIIQKKQTMKWDRKRKKYVQVTGNVDVNKISKTKRIKTESGQIINAPHKTTAYEDWKKKSKTEIQREGELERGNGRSNLSSWKRDHQFKHKAAVSKKGGPQNELKSSEQILKARKQKAKLAAKNKPKKKKGRK